MYIDVKRQYRLRFRISLRCPSSFKVSRDCHVSSSLTFFENTRLSPSNAMHGVKLFALSGMWAYYIVLVRMVLATNLGISIRDLRPPIFVSLSLNPHLSRVDFRMDEGSPEGDDDVEGVVLGNRNSIPSSTIPQLGRPGGFDTPTTLERLPIELITQIVRDVRSDKKALTAIASLNKAWREFCLPYLFECMVVKSPQPGQLLRFLIFAEGRPHIRPHIKHLILCPSGPPSPDRYLVVDSLEVIKRILACLRSLQALTLRHVWFRDCQGLSDGFADSAQDPTIVRIDRDGPYPLSRLIVDGCLAGPWGTQGEFYGLFAGVLTLFRVRIVWFRSFRTPFQMPRGVALREIIRKDPPMIHGVEHLVLKPAPTREFTRDIVNALRARLAPDTLRSIVLVEASKVLIRAVGILIQDKARGVAELSLDATKIDASYLENTPGMYVCLLYRAPCFVRKSILTLYHLLSVLE